MTHRLLTRRGFVAGTAGAAAALGFDGPASAQMPANVPPLRIGMSISDIPRMWGGPEAGFEGLRFGAYMVYDALINWDMSRADAPSGLRPGLATAWRVDPADARRWILTLREGVRFHDGSPFDADAAIWNFESVINQQAPQFHGPRVGLIRTRMTSVAAVEKIDQRTIAVITGEPDGMVLYQLSFLMMVSPTRWRDLGGDWNRFAMNPSGTGPYSVVSITPRERCELAANTEYWEPARVPRTARTVLVPIPDGNARVAALRGGGIDIAESVPPDTIASLRQAGAQVVQNSYPHVWAWRFNVNPGTAFADIRVRRAANLAIDRDGIVRLVSGTALPAKGKVLPGDPWYGRPGFDIRHDPEGARRLMREAGFSATNRLPLRVIIASGGGGQMVPLPMNEAIQENLRDVWMDVTFDVVDFTTIINMLRQGTRSDALRTANAINIAIPSIDPTTGWIIYDSALTAPRGVNWGWYANPAVDAQLRVMRQAFTPEAQNAAMSRLHELLVDDAAALFVVHDLNPRGLGPRVRGFVQARNWFQDYTPISVTPTT